MTELMHCPMCGKKVNKLYMLKCWDCFVLLGNMHREGKYADCAKLIWRPLKDDAE